MANLSTLLQNKQTIAQISETNLDQGQVFVFYAGRQDNNFRCELCWSAPSDGVAYIEIWGASGSSARLCCCGIGVPGNPGAYAKKTMTFTAGQRISGNVGLSCGNSSQICFRGCSCWTGLNLCGAECTCMCAEGGLGGRSLQVDGNGSPYCCAVAAGLFGTNVGNAGCGIICNYGSGFFLPSAYGGDVNCSGQFSCLEVGHCNASCWCCHKQHIRTSAGVYSSCPSTIVATGDNAISLTGMYVDSFFQGVSGTSASPTFGSHYRYCWNSGQYCGCYEAQGCSNMIPVGIPAPGATGCANVRDHGLRGGHGGVKIRFVSAE